VEGEFPNVKIKFGRISKNIKNNEKVLKSFRITGSSKSRT